MAHPIVEQELELLARVRAALANTAPRERASERGIVREMERLRGQILEGAAAEDRGALQAEYNRQAALLGQLRAAGEGSAVADGSPYFAHMRLHEGTRSWDVCLGKATFVHSGVNVVDWRHAPISKIYYRYHQGEEFEEEIAGRTRCGQVVSRRAVTIREGKLLRVDAPEGSFRVDPQAQGNWTQVREQRRGFAAERGAQARVSGAVTGSERRFGGGAAVRADKHLPDIAGLIDAEQFALLSRPSSGLVVIRGSAGSGKTTVALHRIAYLAYQDERFDSPESLVVVFSRALRDYVAHVLPALGITRVRVCTFAEWAAELRRAHFPALPRDVRDDAPAVVQRCKQHPVALELLSALVRDHPGRGAVRALDDWNSMLIDVGRLRGAVSRTAPGAFSSDEIERIADWSRKQSAEISSYLEGDRDADAALTPQDDALLLRAWQLRAGTLRARGRPLRYRHVAIDEVQDFSPLEARVLFDCLDERRSMTMAGDTQQHVLQDAGFASWQEFFRHLGIDGQAVDTLRVSYRSSAEIVRFALSVLGPLREDESAPQSVRHGPPVEMFRFTDHGACVAFLSEALQRLAIDDPLASVALLTPSESLSDLYERALCDADVSRVHRVREQRFSFAPGVEICEVIEGKGLEFDYVVLVEASSAHYPATDASRRLLHVGATRAIHQLWITSVATPSPLLKEAVGDEK